MFATGGGQLRRKRTCSKQDACSYEEANQRRNGARPYCEGKTFCSKQSGSSYTEVEHLRNRRRSVAKKKDLFQTGCVQLRRSNTCSQRDAFNCDQVVRVRNRERSVTSKPASRCCSRILAPGPLNIKQLFRRAEIKIRGAPALAQVCESGHPWGSVPIVRWQGHAELQSP